MNSSISNHELRWIVSWNKIYHHSFRETSWVEWHVHLSLKLGSLKIKPIPCKDFTTECQSRLVASASPENLHPDTVFSSLQIRIQFFLQVQLLPAPFSLDVYVSTKACYTLTDCPTLSLSLCFPLWALSKLALQAWKLWFEIFFESLYLCTLRYQILSSRWKNSQLLLFSLGTRMSCHQHPECVSLPFICSIPSPPNKQAICYIFCLQLKSNFCSWIVLLWVIEVWYYPWQRVLQVNDTLYKTFFFENNTLLAFGLLLAIS